MDYSRLFDDRARAALGDAAVRRTADRLLALKDHLDQDWAHPDLKGVPARGDDRLLLATWNIREFDSPAYGARSLEPLCYIAEIISRFDLVALQEVHRDLRALDELRALLGNWWQYLVTDVTEGTRGNDERMAFLYDTRKVRFSGLAARSRSRRASARTREAGRSPTTLRGNSRARPSCAVSSRAGRASSCALCTSSTGRAPPRTRSASKRSA